MKQLIKYLFLSGMLNLFLGSCNEELELNQYIEHINQDKDYIKNYEDEVYRMECKYRPSELIVIDEFKNSMESNNKLSKAVFNKELKKYENALYFDVRIGLKSNQNIVNKNISTQAEYAALLSELTYNMMRDIYIVGDGRDTIYATGYNYNNSYGSSPDVRFLFAFPKKRAEQHKILDIIYDDKIFGIGAKIKMTYSLSEINKKLPALKFN